MKGHTMARHETRWWTGYSGGTETHTLACDVEGCGWEIAITDATKAGALRAAREHVELVATIKAKQENDERFLLERDEARNETAQLREHHDALVNGLTAFIPEEYDCEDAVDAIILRWAEDMSGHARIAVAHNIMSDERDIAINEASELRKRVDELHAALNTADAKYNEAVNRLTKTVSDLRKMNAAMSTDAAFLGALEAAGVDNWEGYEIAQELMKEENDHAE
jgi:hypothetical protein